MIRGHEACSGCGICAMSCPVWWETRDVWFTPHGRARALQGGAGVEDIADSVLSCRMCGACEPACPERIDIVPLVRSLRVQLDEQRRNPFTRKPVAAPHSTAEIPKCDRLLLAGPGLEAKPELLERVVGSLGGTHRVHVGADDGRDLAWAFEAGAPVDGQRLERFLDGLSRARELIVIEGILHKPLRERRPGFRIRGLAETLLDGSEIASVLGPRDLLVLEARAYHADHARLVRRFNDLRSHTHCQINLDLQRLAIPTSSEGALAWMLEGRDVDRIVVESPSDLDTLTAWADIPVVHLSALVAEAR